MTESIHAARAVGHGEAQSERDVGGEGKSQFDLVLIAASADGLVAIGSVLAGLPADFPIPIAVVLHRTPSPASHLEALLAKKCKLAVTAARAGDRLRPGTVYVAPATHHLVVRADHTLHLMNGSKIRHLRSSA